MEKLELERFPGWLREDIEKMDILRAEMQRQPDPITLIHLKSQFDMLVSSLKCAQSEGILSRSEAAEIREEYSTY